MVRFYALLWHICHPLVEVTEGEAGVRYEAAETRRPTAKEAKAVLEFWLVQQQEACSNPRCEHTSLILDGSPCPIRGEMVSMIANAVKV
jgi:hypothetical protein